MTLSVDDIFLLIAAEDTHPRLHSLTTGSPLHAWTDLNNKVKSINQSIKSRITWLALLLVTNTQSHYKSFPLNKINIDCWSTHIPYHSDSCPYLDVTPIEKSNLWCIVIEIKLNLIEMNWQWLWWIVTFWNAAWLVQGDFCCDCRRERSICCSFIDARWSVDMLRLPWRTFGANSAHCQSQYNKFNKSRTLHMLSIAWFSFTLPFRYVLFWKYNGN